MNILRKMCWELLSWMVNASILNELEIKGRLEYQIKKKNYLTFHEIFTDSELVALASTASGGSLGTENM